MTGKVRVDHAVSSGTFSLDGETHEVDNNIWVVGDDTECVVIDAPHSISDILALVGDRKVRAILLTHAHDDHCRVAPALREEVVAPIMLHPDDKVLWDLTHTDLWDVDLHDGFEINVGDTTLRALHTPGHAPGAVCFYAPTSGASSPATPCSKEGPAQPAARTATRTSSSPQSARRSSCSPRRPWSTPGTVTTPPSAPSGSSLLRKQSEPHWHAGCLAKRWSRRPFACVDTFRSKQPVTLG